jgi:hypothetical protein
LFVVNAPAAEHSALLTISPASRLPEVLIPAFSADAKNPWAAVTPPKTGFITIRSVFAFFFAIFGLLALK